MSNVLPGHTHPGCRRLPGQGWPRLLAIRRTPTTGAFQVAGVGDRKPYVIPLSLKEGTLSGWHPRNVPRRAGGLLRGAFFGGRRVGETDDRTNARLRNTQVTSWGYFRVLLYGDVRMRFRPNHRWGRSRITLRAHRTADHHIRKPHRLGQNSPLRPWGKALRRLFCVWFRPAGGGTEQGSSQLTEKLTSCRLAN